MAQVISETGEVKWHLYTEELMFMTYMAGTQPQHLENVNTSRY